LIGLDVARAPVRLQTRSWAPLVAAGLAGSLFLATLRMDVLRMRFSVAEHFEEQLRLEQTERDLTVRMRQLRDPAALSERARELGFRRAEQLIYLHESEPWRDPARPPAAPRSRTIELASASAEPAHAAARRPGPRLPEREH
jgi:hypothetical protein